MSDVRITTPSEHPEAVEITTPGQPREFYCPACEVRWTELEDAMANDAYTERIRRIEQRAVGRRWRSSMVRLSRVDVLWLIKQLRLRDGEVQEHEGR